MTRNPASPALAVTALLAVVLLTAGCLEPRDAKVESQATQAKYPQIVVINNFLPWIAAFDPVVTASDGDAPMAVSVPVRLKGWHRREVQYRFIFLDDDGRPVGPGMDWRWEVLNPRTLVYLEAAALDPAATDWRLEIRKSLRKN